MSPLIGLVGYLWGRAKADTLSVPVPAAAVFRIGPPVQAVLIVFFHDKIKGGAAVGVIGVLVKITGQPFAFFRPAFEIGRTLAATCFETKPIQRPTGSGTSASGPGIPTVAAFQKCLLLFIFSSLIHLK